MRVRRARAHEVPAVRAVEVAAASMFDGTGLLDDVPDEPAADEILREAVHDHRLWVAEVQQPDAETVVGFALAIWCGDDTHLQELDVVPEWGRRGIGRALVAEVRAWAAHHGRDRLTLTTFADIPWNAPFYARLGFAVLPEAEWTPALHAVWRHEAGLGLPMEQRVVMAAPIT